MSQPPLVIANWKMNGDRALVKAMAEAFAGDDAQALQQQMQMVVCPPATLLGHLQAIATNSGGAFPALGAQSASAFASGAHTGEISLPLLQECGVSYVLVGHSERRELYGEDDAVVAAKLAAILQSGLTAVLCVGETAIQRESGHTESVLEQQLSQALQAVTPSLSKQLIIAYEPVWAIGTGLTATPQQAQATHAFIREVVTKQLKIAAKSISLLYGGSVKPDNAASLFAEPDIDGGLIGGASLDAESYLAICAAAADKRP